jgi:hypothetical protein
LHRPIETAPFLRPYPVKVGDYLRIVRIPGVGPYFVTFRSVIE